MSLLPDTGAMRAHATVLINYANHLRNRSRVLARRVEATHWRGTAASVFHHQSADLTRGMDTTADLLVDAALALRAHADAVDAKLGELHHWLSAAGKFLGDVSGALVDTGDIDSVIAKLKSEVDAKRANACPVPAHAGAGA